MTMLKVNGDLKNRMLKFLDSEKKTSKACL